MTIDDTRYLTATIADGIKLMFLEYILTLIEHNNGAINKECFDTELFVNSEYPKYECITASHYSDKRPGEIMRIQNRERNSKCPLRRSRAVLQHKGASKLFDTVCCYCPCYETFFEWFKEFIDELSIDDIIRVPVQD